jgi:hypothetical protein
LTRSPFPIVDGCITLPDKPGLGIEIDREQIQAAHQQYLTLSSPAVTTPPVCKKSSPAGRLTPKNHAWSARAGTKEDPMTTFRPHGIIPPIVTPVTSDGSFDASAQRRLIEHLLANGVHGIFPLGTTGEFYAFSAAQTEQILANAVKACAGKVPVYGAPTTSPPAAPLSFARSPKRSAPMRCRC